MAQLRLTDITTGQVQRTVIAGRDPSAVALTQDGNRVYANVDWGRAIMQFAPATDRIIATFGVAAAGHGAFMWRISLSDAVPTAQPGQRFAAENPTQRCGR